MAPSYLGLSLLLLSATTVVSSRNCLNPDTSQACSDIASFSKIEVQIPRYIQAGDTADLICSYNVDSHNLYSVKWYKGHHEFYRFTPNDKPPVKVFPVNGMKINMTASDHVRVVLESVSRKMTGTYLCEVTVTPTFFALAETANMTVIDFPAEGPVINVERKQFQVGETAHVTFIPEHPKLLQTKDGPPDTPVSGVRPICTSQSCLRFNLTMILIIYSLVFFRSQNC